MLHSCFKSQNLSSEVSVKSSGSKHGKEPPPLFQKSLSAFVYKEAKDSCSHLITLIVKKNGGVAKCLKIIE